MRIHILDEFKLPDICSSMLFPWCQSPVLHLGFPSASHETFCLPLFFWDAIFWYDFGLVIVEANVQRLLSTPLPCCTCLVAPSSVFPEYCRVRTLQLGKEFWAVTDAISEIALQLVYSPANTAQDEAGLCPKGTLLARVQLIYLVGALCASVLLGKANKIHALFTHSAWNSLSSTSSKK